MTTRKAAPRRNARVDRPPPLSERDAVDSIIEEWQREFPSTDQSAKEITTRLVRLGALIDTIRRVELSKLGITSGEYAVLATLRRMGPPYRRAPTELARDLSMTSAGMTAALNRVERKGFVERTANPADRRGSLVCLTESGHRLSDEAMAQQIDLDHRLVAGIAPAQRRSLTPLLRDLLRQLEPHPVTPRLIPAPEERTAATAVAARRFC